MEEKAAPTPPRPGAAAARRRRRPRLGRGRGVCLLRRGGGVGGVATGGRLWLVPRASPLPAPPAGGAGGRRGGGGRPSL